ncbi:hypothetical protein [Odoribacter laneus]|uniref:hypothetical protein n=1 Tax=Odoribacter laneus TaxID=626933 RepID=UPI00033A63B8|nr:hypothetical protein [Odoribacter laneus]CCZ80578.1 putative uncharacterized protein [Odoribacter laneus CAG:561]
MQTEFNSMGFLAIAIILAIIVNALILLYYVYEMASKNGRSSFYWVVFSLCLTPIVSIILLSCIGETEEKRKERLLKDEEYLRLMLK